MKQEKKLSRKGFVKVPTLILLAICIGIGGVSTALALSSPTPPGSPEPNCGPLNFTSAGYNVNSRPFALAIGDFDGDGKIDLASANYFSGSTSDNITLLFGNGNGPFDRFANYQFGALPRAIATGDFNRDGKLDLVVCHSGSNAVTILFNDGRGAFPRGSAFIINDPRSVAVGDFNGDGAPDLAATEFGSNYLWVIPVNRDGIIQAAERYVVGQDPICVVTGDFNKDGKLDLATADFSANTISVQQNRGDGKFQAAITYSVGGAPESIAVGDFNLDGKPDLAVAQSGTTTLTAFINSTVCEPTIPTFTFLYGVPNPSKAGPEVSFRIKVYSADGRTTPTGQVQLLEHGSALSPWLPLSEGKARFSTYEFKPGLHWIVARFSGDARHRPSNGITIQIVFPK